MTQLKTHPELSKCLRPQTDTERSKLTASIAADGVRDPIIEWDGYILDGHNRIEVARKLGKDYKTIKMEFADIYAAKQWMRDNQRARRNLEDIEVVRLLQDEAADLKAKAKERMSEGGQGLVKLPNLPPTNTAEIMAGSAGVSTSQYQHLSKVVTDGAEDLQIQVREKNISASDAAKIVRKVGSVKPAEVKKPDTTAADTLFAKQEAERKQAEYEAQVAAEAKRAELAAERQRIELAALKQAKELVNKDKEEARRIKREQHAAKVERAAAAPTPVQTGTPQLVRADPPWRYDHQEAENRAIENHYMTATMDEIEAHKPETTKDAILLMWATAPKMVEAMDLMKVWGFKYKTQAIWDKQIIGMGYWFRGQHEILLVGVKGNPGCTPVPARCSSIFSEKRGKHSKKPEIVYDWIENAFPGMLKMEMYCREPRGGWLCWGNEV